MNKFNKIVLLATAMFTSVGISTAVVTKQNAIVESASAATKTTVSAEEIASYYSSISSSATGTTLLNALNSLNTSKRKKTVGYDGFRQFAAKCEVDPTGSSNKIIGFYDNAKLGPSWDSAATWNREHVWPKSRNGSAVEADAHMVRAASTKTNGDRGNDFFASNVYDPGDTSKGRLANYRGIAARIIFYCAIADTSLKIIDASNGSGGQMGKLSDLLKWNLQYQPSTSSSAALELQVEQNRNNVIYKDSAGQGNRNPFIDHPEYACKIWGNTNETTKGICGGTIIDDNDDDDNKTKTTVHAGTQADPYSVADALKPEVQDNTDHYVTGVVSDDPTTGSQGDFKFHIKDENASNSLYIFYAKPNGKTVKKGDYVVLNGSIITYGTDSTIEMSKPTLVSVGDKYQDGWKVEGNGTGGGGGGGGTGGGETGGDAKKNNCQGSIVGSASVILFVAALGGFLYFVRRRKVENN